MHLIISSWKIDFLIADHAMKAYLESWNERAITGMDNLDFALLQPVRFKIIRELKKAKEPLYIEDIAKRIGESPRLTSFHLATLQEKGFVRSEFRVVKAAQSKGKAGRFFELTEQVDKSVSKLIKELNED